MKTIKDVQDEVRRVGVDVLAHNYVHPEQVGRAIIALNQVVCDLEPLAAEASDLLALEEAFQPLGGGVQADDPGMYRVRIPTVEYETMRAMKESIQTRRRLARLRELTVPVSFEPDMLMQFSVDVPTGRVAEWLIDGEVVHRGRNFTVPPGVGPEGIRVRLVGSESSG